MLQPMEQTEYAKFTQRIIRVLSFSHLKKDKEMRQWVNQEKARLAVKMMEEKKNGMPVSAPVKQSRRHWHCDDIVINE